MITFGNYTLGPGHPPFIVAELSGNHNGEFDRALRLIEVAAECGVDAVKLQIYTPDTLSLPDQGDDFVVNADELTWKGRKSRELYELAHTPPEWSAELFEKGRSLGLVMFSSVFDIEGVELLESLDTPIYKVASPELTHLPLIDRIIETGKPMILSTGASEQEEVEHTVAFLRRRNALQRTVILHCVSVYPASPETLNLRTMQDIATRFGVITGLSDHSLGSAAAIAATALDASVIEKHLTLDRSDGGPDAFFSLEPEELRDLVKGCAVAFASMGSVQYGLTSEERKFAIHRQRFVTAKQIKKGEALGPENLRSIRSPKGIPTYKFERVYGQVAKRDLARHTVLYDNFFDDHS